jgi:benzoyl-CoA reductase subunit A
MGGQDCKAIRCDEKGKVTNFVMNDKCAAGTGRYLERTADTLGLPLEDTGALSLQPVDGAATISSFCAVFAQSEIISLLRQGRHVNDLLAGACEAITERTSSLLGRVEVEEVFSITGGVAKNTGVVKRLAEKLGVKAVIAPDPQIVGAVGAALFARERLLKQQSAA